MYKFETSTLIKCRANDLYNFHLDITNIKKITPQGIRVEVIDKPTILVEGTITSLKVTKFFIPQNWIVEYSLLESPSLIVDTALFSPFKFWRHSHIFTQKDEWCELKDVIEYELPFGILGRLFHGFVNRDIKKMFEYRHVQTKRILESL